MKRASVTSMVPKPHHVCFSKTGFRETIFGGGSKERSALESMIISINGAGMVTVPRIFLPSDFAKEICRNKVRSSACNNEQLAKSLKEFGKVPVSVSKSGNGRLERGIYPLSDDLDSVAGSICSLLMTHSYGDVYIQPAFGDYKDARGYGLLYGPLYSGRAIIGSEITTSVDLGYPSEGRKKVSLGDKTPVSKLADMKSRLIQVNGASTMLIDLSYRPELGEETLSFVFERLGRLKSFGRENLILDWAVTESSGRKVMAVTNIENELVPERHGALEGRALNTGKVTASKFIFDYGMNRQGKRNFDVLNNNYVTMIKGTDIRNLSLQASDFSNAAAVIIYVDVPENEHFMTPFAREVAAAGKIVFLTENIQSKQMMEIIGKADSHGCVTIPVTVEASGGLGTLEF